MATARVYFSASESELATLDIARGPAPTTDRFEDCSVDIEDRPASNEAVRIERSTTAADFDIVVDSRIDPIVGMARIEAVIRSVDVDLIIMSGGAATVIAFQDGSTDAWVTRLRPEAEQVLRDFRDADRMNVVRAFVTSGEVLPSESASLDQVLVELAGLASRASNRGQYVYCWTSSSASA